MEAATFGDRSYLRISKVEISYSFICKTASDIPEKSLPHLDEEIVTSIGSGFKDIFPQFSLAFPKTSSVIEREWSHPVLALEKGAREWLAFIVVQNEDKNLFFHLQPEFMEKEGELFDEDYEMLPASWKELYRWFDSFCVTGESYAPMNWWNTPFRFSGRLDRSASRPRLRHVADSHHDRFGHRDHPYFPRTQRQAERPCGAGATGQCLAHRLRVRSENTHHR